MRERACMYTTDGTQYADMYQTWAQPLGNV